MSPVWLSRVLGLAIVATTLAACSSGQATPPTTQTSITTTTAVTSTTTPLSAVDLSVTPAGWVPVAYGDAQISVPADWNASYGSTCDFAYAPGSVFVGLTGYGYSGTPSARPVSGQLSTSDRRSRPIMIAHLLQPRRWSPSTVWSSSEAAARASSWHLPSASK